MNRKPSEIIRLALQPEYGYLIDKYADTNGKVYLKYPYFCGVLKTLSNDNIITEKEWSDVDSIVYDSLKGLKPDGDLIECIFLKSYLERMCIIPLETKKDSTVYYSAAMKHWNNLADRLESVGL